MLKAEEIERSKDQPAQLRIENPSNSPAGERAAELRTDRHESPSVTPIDPAKRSDAIAADADRGARTVHKQRVRWALFAALPIALLAGAYWYVTGGRVMSTDDAYVEADTVGISTDISGIVQDVDVRDNAHVAAGQVLYRLDPRQFQITLDNAKANLAQTALTIDAMKQDYQRMLSDAAAQQGQVALDQVTFDRNAALLPSGSTSKAIYDQARYSLEVDKNKLQSLRQQAAVQLARLPATRIFR